MSPHLWIGEQLGEGPQRSMAEAELQWEHEMSRAVSF